MIRPTRCLLSIVFVSTIALQVPARAATGHAISFRASDGRMINAIMFDADQRHAAAVVLVPMLGRSKDDWLAIGQRLSDANITALAIDCPASSIPEDPKAANAWASDVRAAVDFLSSRPELRPGALAVLGASLGATIAAIEAAGDSRVRALGLVSATTEYRGIRIEAAMRQYGARPALLLASTHDPYAARSARELAKDAPGPRQVQLSEASGHGTILLSRDPDLVGTLVDWCRRILGVT